MHGKGHRLTPAERDLAVDFYRRGETAAAIGATLGVTGQAIQKTLRRMGVTLRDNHDCHMSRSIKHDAFSVLNDEAAYWVGFLLADGYIHSPRPRVELGLEKSDAEHVAKFRQFLGSDHKVGVKPDSRRLMVSSRQLVADLAKYGVVTCKSLIADPKGGVENIASFWRGMIDGDGHIEIESNCPLLFLLGTHAVASKFKTFCQPYINGYDIQLNESVTKAGTHMWNACMHGDAAMRMLRVLYTGDPVLTRKKEMVQRILTDFKDKKFRVFSGAGRTIHYSGGVTTLFRTISPGNPSCQVGERGERIIASGAHTTERSKVTCQTCIESLTAHDNQLKRTTPHA